MLKVVVFILIILGSGLMVYNIYGFISYARYVKNLKGWSNKNTIINIPIVLLILFLIGYLLVGFAGKPDLIVATILFGGSMFVFVMYLFLRRITQHIVESEELEVKLLAAEESSRVKGEILASMSHEMRTPMNVILGLDSMALNNKSLDEETRGQLEKIGQSGRYLLSIINNILDINDMESGNYESKNTEFRLTEVLDQVGSIAETLSEKKGLDYTFSIEDVARGCYIGDEMILKKVLLSILDNAVKYTEQGGKVSLLVSSEGAATASSEEDENKDIRIIRFTVRDTGVGIDPQFISRVFDVFAQENSGSTNQYGGSGLSLAAAKRMMDLRGGTIRVESEKGSGSEFVVDMPLSFIRPEEEKENITKEKKSLEGLRILIVEDIPENAEIVQDLLELEGVETEIAGNGQIALDMISASSINYYNAILMDLRMPVMDGLEATRRIRKLDRADSDLPIIALTANAFESDIRQTAEAGMNAHLAKPTDADILYETIGRFI